MSCRASGKEDDISWVVWVCSLIGFVLVGLLYLAIFTAIYHFAKWWGGSSELQEARTLAHAVGTGWQPPVSEVGPRSAGLRETADAACDKQMFQACQAKR